MVLTTVLEMTRTPRCTSKCCYRATSFPSDGTERCCCPHNNGKPSLWPEKPVPFPGDNCRFSCGRLRSPPRTPTTPCCSRQKSSDSIQFIYFRTTNLPKEKPYFYEKFVFAVFETVGHIYGQIVKCEILKQRAQRLDGAQFRQRNGFDAVRLFELQYIVDIPMEVFFDLKIGFNA